VCKIIVNIIIFCITYFLYPLKGEVNFIEQNKYIFKIDLYHQFKSGNVIQGITSINNLWLVSQTNHNKKIIFSFLDKNGKVVKHQIIDYPSHGQDLSIKRISKNLFYIITSSKNNNGIAIFKFNTKNNNIIFYKDITLLGKGFNTPTISKDEKFIAVKNCNRIDIYFFKDLLNNYKKPTYSFFLDKIQQKKFQWFQGIVMNKGYVYCLSGNNKINTPKYLIIYNYLGDIIKKYSLNIGRKFALKEGNKWELEGLTIKNNKLYTTVMTGKNGHNIKRLYQILEIKCKNTFI